MAAQSRASKSNSLSSARKNLPKSLSWANSELNWTTCRGRDVFPCRFVVFIMMEVGVYMRKKFVWSSRFHASKEVCYMKWNFWVFNQKLASQFEEQNDLGQDANAFLSNLRSFDLQAEVLFFSNFSLKRWHNRAGVLKSELNALKNNQTCSFLHLPFVVDLNRLFEKNMIL